MNHTQNIYTHLISIYTVSQIKCYHYQDPREKHMMMQENSEIGTERTVFCPIADLV